MPMCQSNLPRQAAEGLDERTAVSGSGNTGTTCDETMFSEWEQSLHTRLQSSW